MERKLQHVTVQQCRGC